MRQGFDPVQARQFAEQWTRIWVGHDADGLAAMCAPTVEFSSPLAAQALGENGWLSSLDEVQRYWRVTSALVPNLTYELTEVWAGVRSLVLDLRSSTNVPLRSVLLFDEDNRIIGVHSHFLSDQLRAG